MLYINLHNVMSIIYFNKVGKNKLIETVPEKVQILHLLSKDYKSTISNILKELKEII